MDFRLPAFTKIDATFSFLVLLSHADCASEITIDFSDLKRISLTALTTLVATVNRWQREGRVVSFSGLDRCLITGYLQRMDVLSICGVDRVEVFTRHESKGQFMPVSKINFQTETLGDEMASCVAPGGETTNILMPAFMI